MDIEKLEKMARLVLADLPNSHSRLYGSAALATRFKNLMSITSKALPEHRELVTGAYQKVDQEFGLTINQARSIIEHIIAIIEIEKTSESKTRRMKIFESANDKLKQASLSFRSGDYASVFHNLNTALELVLKDKLAIPTTITGINTSNIIDIWVKHKLEAHLYLAEARKRVLMIDNKVKHQGYSPSKTDCINGIKAMEELIYRLRSKEISLTEEIKKKIYEGL